MPRRFIRNDNWEFGDKSASSETETGEPKVRKRRFATTLVFTTLFFAGGSLAAVAGDQLSSYLESDGLSAESATPEGQTATPESDAATDAAAAPDATTEATSVDSAATPESSAPDAAAAAAPEATPSDEAAVAVAPSYATSDYNADDGVAPATLAPAAGAPPSAAADAAVRVAKPKPSAARKARLRKARLRTILLPKLKPAPAPEIEGPADAATIWLNSQLPDPTPAALRLSSKFAANLRTAARGNGVDWAVMLGILRARGAAGHNPADRSTLRRLAGRLASYGPTKGDWATIVSYSGDTRFADKAAALARYDRAVGLKALVKGLEAAKESIGARLLADPMVSIYEAGRNDIILNKVDVRVLALIAYLRESFGQVTVSSLISGHRLYARPGVISAHIPGHAVDIAALGDTPIQGHQEPGGITERAVRDILLLPNELMPRQVISLLGMGGPSFPLADHYNHIHIGF